MVASPPCHPSRMPPSFRRAVVALSGDPNGQRLVRLVAELARPTRPSWSAVHVVEIDWTMPLDADVAGRSEEVQRVLDMAEATPRTPSVKLEPVLLQARDVGAALVDEASRARRRPARPRACRIASASAATSRSGGRSRTSSRTRRARSGSCASRCPEETSVKVVIVGCGRVGAVLADDARPRRPRGRRSSTLSTPRLRPPARTRSTGPAIRGDGTDEDVLRRAGAEDGRPVPRADRGRQPQRHGRAARDRDARRSTRSSPRSTTRCGPRPTPSSGSRRSAGRT